MPLTFAVFCITVPENPPVNVTAVLNGTEVLMAWEGPPGRLNGELQGYTVEYSTPAAQQVSRGRSQEGFATLTAYVISYWQLWLFLWTVLCGHWIGHRAVNQPVRAVVQRVFPSMCLYRGREGALDPLTDSESCQSWWVADLSCKYSR